jgi:hypothetical protein
MLKTQLKIKVKTMLSPTVADKKQNYLFPK